MFLRSTSSSALSMSPDPMVRAVLRGLPLLALLPGFAGCGGENKLDVYREPPQVIITAPPEGTEPYTGERINFEAEINFPEDEGIIQVENFGMHYGVDGKVIYGMYIEAIQEHLGDDINIDMLSRLLVDVHLDSSQITESLISPYQVRCHRLGILVWVLCAAPLV